MTIVAALVDYVVGVDTHKLTHTAVVVDARTTAIGAELTTSTDVAGFTALLKWVGAHTTCRRVWAIEGCGSYGRTLTRFLQERGEWVLEVERPARPARRDLAKNDAIDAARAGREILGQPVMGAAQPRTGQIRDALASLLAARSGAVDAATAAMNQFHAELITAPEPIRSRFKALTNKKKIATALALRPDQHIDPAHQGCATALRSIARRHRLNTTEAHDLKARIQALVETWRPDLLEIHGIGPIVAATILVSWSHPGRFRNAEAFTKHAGACPIPASSGQNTHMRLNRGGDRQLNAALHTIMLCRLRTHDQTRTYRARRQQEGQTPRHIQRCLKTYIARQIFKQLENTD